MTPAALDVAMRTLGLSNEGLAHLLGITERTIRNWQSGFRPVPGAVAILLDIVLHHPNARRRFLHQHRYERKKKTA